MGLEAEKVRFIGVSKAWGLGIGWNDAKTKTVSEGELLDRIEGQEKGFPAPEIKELPKDQAALDAYLDGKTAEQCTGLGIAYIRAKNPELAKKCFEKAASMDANIKDKLNELANSYTLLGRLYEKKEKADKAKECADIAAAIAQITFDESQVEGLYRKDSERGLLELLTEQKRVYDANPNDQTAKKLLTTTYLSLGKIYLRNGMFAKATTYLELARNTAAENTNEGAEAVSLLDKVIDPIMDLQIRVELPQQQISTVSYEPELIDQPWKNVRYDAAGRPVFRAKPSSYETSGLNIGIDSPPITFLGLPIVQLGGSLSGVSGEIQNVQYPWSSYLLDPNLPQGYRDVEGNMCTAMDFSAVYRQDLHASLTVPMQPAYRWLGDIFSPVPLLFLNKLGGKWQITQTEVGETAYNTTYDDIFRRLDTRVSDTGTFTSTSTYKALFGETQTVQLFGLDYPLDSYLSGWWELGVRSESEGDVYDMGDDNYVARNYYMNIPFTTEEQTRMRDDYRTFVQNGRNLSATRPRRANEYTLGFRYSMAGPLRWLKLFSIASSEMPNETEEYINASLAYTMVRKDSMFGLYPQTRDVFGGWEKYAIGDTNHNNVEDDGAPWPRDEDGKIIYGPAFKGRSDFHELIESRNVNIFNVKLSYKAGVRNLGSIVSPLDFGAPWSKDFYTGYFDKDCASFTGVIFKGLARAVWLMPLQALFVNNNDLPGSLRFLRFVPTGLAYPIPRALFRFLDGGKTQVYIPMECSFGSQTTLNVRDINTGIREDKHGRNRILGIGLGTDHLQGMYRKGYSNNGDGWESKTWSLIATYRRNF